MSRNDLIIVGVDGSDGARRALRWAIGEARRTGGAVQAVTAWRWEGATLASTDPQVQHEHADRVSAREAGLVIEELGTATPVARDVIEGYASNVLVEAARPARMLVLGSHSHSHLHHAVLGSVSEQCIRHATCPVVVVPAPRPHPAHTADELVPAG